MQVGDCGKVCVLTDRGNSLFIIIAWSVPVHVTISL